MRIDDQGGQEYLVHVATDTGTVQLQLHANPAIAAQLDVDDAGLPRLVEATVEFLLEHQHADDLPALLDLDDVAAAYDHYLETIRQRLGSD